MAYQDSIRVVNLLIRDFLFRDIDRGEESLAERLARTRFAAKFEEPKADTASTRRKEAWERWISFDEGLPSGGLLGSHWAWARLWVHELLSDFRMGELMFTNGSSFEPLGDRTSVACKLTGVWTITADCFELFAKYSYWHRGLKHAAKKRFLRYCRTQVLSVKAINRILWNRFKNSDDPAFEIYKFKLYCSVKFVRGNRWSTVPKNNLKDRSICLEPLCNMLVQRAVGLGLRKCLKDKIGIDLDHLADEHRNRISDQKVATIDLSDCSDAISVRLINYLLPKRVLSKVHACRSDMTLGPDDNYYIVNKVSSMGNGFTFDLMTVVLTALTRSFDPTSTVFGDDIICQNSVAADVISNLQIAGFVVNSVKTNVNSNYRESCGAHFVDTYGYVTSFDIKWVSNIQDLIVTMNKVAILSIIYKEPYEALRAKIWACVPPTLLGAATLRLVANVGKPPSYQLDGFVRFGPLIDIKPKPRTRKLLRRKIRPLHKSGELSIATGYETRVLPAKHDLSSSEWDVFYQYLRNSRISRKVPRMVIKPSLVARVGEEQIGFTNALLP